MSLLCSHVLPLSATVAPHCIIVSDCMSALQLAGAEAGKPACMALLSVFEAGRQPRLAMQVLLSLMCQHWLLKVQLFSIHGLLRIKASGQKRLLSFAQTAFIVYEVWCHVQLLDALGEESSPTQLDRDVMLAALRVCAKAGAWESALRVWERLQSLLQQQSQQSAQSAQLRNAAAQLVLQACKTGKNASKAAELATEFRRLGFLSNYAS